MKRWLFLIVILLIGGAALAQEQEVANIEPLPTSVMLEGLIYTHQDTNRCSAAALSMQLSYFEQTSPYYDIIPRLNPYGADASVRIEEMAEAAQERGLGAVVRRGGTVDLLRQLVAGGFPVLVENVYYDGPDGWNDWLSHNRVLVGYDDGLEMLYFYDPLLGYAPNGHKIVEYAYSDMDSRWRPFNRDYLVLYRPEEEAAVRAILGEHWDEEYNAVWTLFMAQEEIDNGSADSFTYFNMGWAQLQLGQMEEAAASFDTALGNGLPWRMLWYEFGPFEAYLAVGRYQDVIYLANQQISNAGNTISVEEWYYYAGRAYEAQGNLERARVNYEVAVYRNSHFTAARERLSALMGG